MKDQLSTLKHKQPATTEVAKTNIMDSMKLSIAKEKKEQEQENKDSLVLDCLQHDIILVQK